MEQMIRAYDETFSIAGITRDENCLEVTSEQMEEIENTSNCFISDLYYQAEIHSNDRY